MAKKKTNTSKSESIEVKAEEVHGPSKHWQSFKVLKKFPTDGKTYEVGETFRHYDERVINFLKSQKII
jgi:hypothetical protein